MCAGTKVKYISLIGGLLGIAISSFTLIGLLSGIIGGRAIASNKLDTLWGERTTNEREHTEIGKEMSSMNAKIDILLQDSTLIKQILMGK